MTLTTIALILGYIMLIIIAVIALAVVLFLLAVGIAEIGWFSIRAYGLWRQSRSGRPQKGSNNAAQ